ncbi:protein gamma response 1 [Pistacia vera]|uniref:protein gamma response 1 n=1 Tax=Pistacia vera TaxID=55513 RepID=UPI001262C1DF|nr:protein gamma response 1 [Pistacia vera]
MEGHLQASSKLGCPADSNEAKYISGLSTILVATIQEAKDRISQIEYIFCSQIYPNFQANSKSLQNIYSEAREAAEDAWREKENSLLLEMKQLRLEKQQALEENQSLKLEMENPLKEQEKKINQLLSKLESQQLKIDELEKERMQKSKEVDEGIELQGKLLHLFQSKVSVIVDQSKQIKEHEERAKTLTAELNSHKKKVDELQKELSEKIENVARRKDLTEKIEMLFSDISNNEQLLTDLKNEKKLLIDKLEGFEENVRRLQEELRKKMEEVEEERKLQGQLLQQIDLNSVEVLKIKQRLEECEKEKKLLLDKVEGLEEKVNELKLNLNERSGEADGGRDSDEKLLQQIKQKDSELVAEKKKRRDVIDAYKRLKSQYNFLCAKSGLTTENLLQQNKLEDENDSFKQHQNPVISPDLEDKSLNTSAVHCDTNKVKNEFDFSDNLEGEKGAKSFQTSSFQSATSNLFITPKCPSNVKSAPAAGTKRPASSWRETRSRQCQGGVDPHDDFLDTPLENIRGNLNKAMKEDVHDIPGPAQEDMNPDSSDDETQDMNVDPAPQRQQKPDPIAGKRGYKYVEPVRKKAERENLKGVECKQCKKFYDAVLPNDGGKDSDCNKKNFRCEHHEGVSRHRYKYIPPMTPEGFWNIGFESEM